MGAYHNKVYGSLFRKVQNCPYRMRFNDFEFQINSFCVDSEDLLDML